MSAYLLKITFLCCCTTYIFVTGQSGGRYEILLSENPVYLLAWEFSQNRESVMFDATVETLAYVGLGLSKTGTMEGADLLLGGIRNNGEYYYDDYHGVGNTVPLVDDSQDWYVAVATENTTHTFLLHDRKLDTGDTRDDIVIQDEHIYLLWSIGAADDLVYHGERRGALYINLLNPSESPVTTPENTNPSNIPSTDLPVTTSENTNPSNIPTTDLPVTTSENANPSNIPTTDLPVTTSENTNPSNIPTTDLPVTTSENANPSNIPTTDLPVTTSENTNPSNIPTTDLPVTPSENTNPSNIPTTDLPVNTPENTNPPTIPNTDLPVSTPESSSATTGQKPTGSALISLSLIILGIQTLLVNSKVKSTTVNN